MDSKSGESLIKVIRFLINAYSMPVLGGCISVIFFFLSFFFLDSYYSIGGCELKQSYKSLTVGAVLIMFSGYSIAVTGALASLSFLFFFPNDELSLIIKSCFDVDY